MIEPFYDRVKTLDPIVSTNQFILGVIGCYASAAFGEYVDPDIGEDETDTMELCSTIFAIVGKFGVSGTFGVIYVHASELYPTPVRSIGVGIASAMGRVGGILAPLVASLGGFLPMIIFGSLGVLQVNLRLRF